LNIITGSYMSLVLVTRFVFARKLLIYLLYFFFVFLHGINKSNEKYWRKVLIKIVLF